MWLLGMMRTEGERRVVRTVDNRLIEIKRFYDAE